MALRGIRYDDKSEFFSSLESTVMELVSLPYESDEKLAIENVLGVNCRHFKLKPGHRNLIMNLMLEIDKVDVEEFFSKAMIKDESSRDATFAATSQQIFKSSTVEEHIKSSPKKRKENVMYQISDHVYTNEEQEGIEQQDFCNMENEVEYVFEEYLEDQTGKYEYKMDKTEPEAPTYIGSSKKKSNKKKRKPDRMYNDEFLSMSMNPRKRRVSTRKVYPDSDEGITERFCDLIKQSMECILSHSKLEEVMDVPIIVNKESETSWTVVCPLCEANIKLAIAIENNGRYRNYKRSNFERHLRFKHCKEEENVTEAIMSIHEFS